MNLSYHRLRSAFAAQSLFEDIGSGRYAVGGLLPTEADLCRQFAVSRHTVREAYRTGRGKVILRAKYTIEEQKDGRSQIIFTEIRPDHTVDPRVLG